MGWRSCCLAGIAIVCGNRGEEHEGFVGDSVAVVLSLQMPDLENGGYVSTFYQKLLTHEMESFFLSHGILDAFCIIGLVVFLSECIKRYWRLV